MVNGSHILRPQPARALASGAILAGLALTSVFLPSAVATDVFAFAAHGVGACLCLGTVAEMLAGPRNLIRVDVLMLWALYGLTFAEFWFPQTDIDTVVTTTAAIDGTRAVLLGFAGLVIGRHLVPWRSSTRLESLGYLTPKHLFLLLCGCAFLGYLYVLLAVNFDPFELFRQLSLPRFSRTWGRERYGGDLYSLLVEVGALIFLIPPLCGIIYARSKDYTFFQKSVVTLLCLFTFYFGFASGTRHVLVVYAVSFLVAYFLNKSDLRLSTMLYQGAVALIVLTLAAGYMLAFRDEGLGNFSFTKAPTDTLYVDHAMVVISQLTQVFPDVYGYLGFEIPFNGLIHPIPRFLWPGKPDGLSISIESAVGAGPVVTLAVTFVGEAYISGGPLGALIAGLTFGAAAEMWNRVARVVNSPFALLLYASGFFAAMLAMRSLLWVTVSMLPTIALWVAGKFLLPSRAVQVREPLPNSKKRPAASAEH